MASNVSSPSRPHCLRCGNSSDWFWGAEGKQSPVCVHSFVPCSDFQRLRGRFIKESAQAGEWGRGVRGGYGLM